MSPQKRGRKDATRDSHVTDDAEMNGKRPLSSESEDDDDSEDELTFTERMDEDDDEDEEMEDASATTDGESNGPINRSVNVEFVFTDPREPHFHSVKQFLLSYLPSSQPFDVSGFANLIVGQRAAGTMVSVEGEDDVYGFITALSIPRYTTQEPHTSMQQILQYLKKKCLSVSKPEFQRLETILLTKNVGLVVNERMINLPYQLVPPLHSALHQDIEWAIQNEATNELRQSFEFDYFLLICTCTMEKSGAHGQGTKKSKTDYAQVSKYFTNFEEEFLETEAEISITFEVEGNSVGVGQEQQSRKYTNVLLIERSRHKAALDTIASMING